MLIDNRNKIKEITLNYPELMAENAKQQIEDLYYDILHRKEHLANLRMDILRLEQELKLKEIDFNKLTTLFDITFEKKNIEEVKGEHNILVKNDSDYRNVKI